MPNLTTPRTEADLPASSLQLDGNGSYVQCAANDAYDFGEGDFTVEAWVLPAGPGVLVARISAEPMQDSGWSLSLDADGTLRFGTWDLGAYFVGATSGPTPLFDGSWHHVAAVRQGREMFVYVDGVPYPLSIALNTGGPVDVSNNLPLTIGANTLEGNQTARNCFKGNVDEVRLWSAALPQWRIAQGVYHVMSSATAALVGQWGFDDGTARDSSSVGNDGTLYGRAGYGAPGFYFVPEGQPYLLVQALLMQDYQATSGGAQETTTYRAVIGLRNSDGSVRSGTIQVWADRAVTATVGGTSRPLGPSAPVSFAANPLGQVAISVPDGGSLLAPVLRVRADFMQPDERIVIPLDRQAHFKLSTVTGPQLTAGPSALLDPSKYTPDQAASVASVLSNVMATAVQHDMQPADPEIVPSSSSRPAVRLLGSDPATPEKCYYLPVETPCPCCDPTSDMIKCCYLSADVPVLRRVIPAFMPDPHWRFSVQDRSFTPLPPGEARLHVALRSAALPANVSVDSLWDDFVDGVLSVVDVVVSVGQTVADGISMAFDYVKDGVRSAFSYVVRTLEDAVGFVTGLLNQLGVAVGRLIDHLKALFDWSDVLVTHKVLTRVVTQMAQFTIDSVQGAKQAVGAFLDDVQAQADAKFRQWIDGLTGSPASVGSQTTQAPPQDVRSGYLLNAVADGPPSQELQGDAPMTADQLYSLIQQAQTAAGSGPDTLQGRLEGPADSLFADASQIAQQALAAILKALQQGLDVAVGLLKSVVEALFDLLQDALEYALELLTTRIDLPLVTYLYEEVICGGDGSRLTMLDLLCLVGALPATVIHKLVNGNRPPFTPEQARQILAMPYSEYGFLVPPGQVHATLLQARREGAKALTADGGDDKLPDWVKPLSYALGAVFSFAVLLWFFAMATVDAEKSLFNAGVGANLKMMFVCEAIAQVVSYPIHSPSAMRSGAPLCETIVWWTQMLPLTMDGVSMGVSLKNATGAFGQAWNGKLGTLLTAGYGVCHVVGFAILRYLEGPDGGSKAAQNILSAMPEVAKFTRLDPKVGVVACPIVDGVAGALVAIINFGRIGADAKAQAVHESR